jgi:hypothetical protein
MGTLLLLAAHPVDIVAAVYPKREEPITYPVKWDETRPLLYSDENGLIEVAGAATGCLRLSRRVLEALTERHADNWYWTGEGKRNVVLFDFETHDHVFHGEDYVFCRKAREAGFKVYIDPEIDMEHIGIKKYEGNIGKWLRSRIEKEKEAA